VRLQSQCSIDVHAGWTGKIRYILKDKTSMHDDSRQGPVTTTYRHQ
jgi:hypothetical protein